MISPKFLKDMGKSSIISGAVLLGVAAVYKLMKSHV
jgi:hypothetical protein